MNVMLILNVSLPIYSYEEKKKTRINSQIFQKLKTKLWVAGEIVSDYMVQYRIYTQTQP